MTIFQIVSRKRPSAPMVAHYYRMSDYDMTIDIYNKKLANGEIVEFEVSK